MELVNPISAFRWNELDINGVMLRGIPEKQGHSFSRAGFLAASKDLTTDADEWGRAVRQKARPLSAVTLGEAKRDYHERKVIGFPRYFIIEPASVCNKRCPFCPIDIVKRYDESGQAVPPGLMRWSDFSKLLDECRGERVYGLSLYQLGESMLWSDRANGDRLDIGDMIRAARGAFPVVNLSTNGDVANLDRVLDTGLSDLIISIDGLTEDVYLQNRPSAKPNDSGAFDRTIERVRNFLALKEQLRNDPPWVRIQIINTASTAAQIENFIRHWIAIPGVDDVFVKSLDSMAPWIGERAVSASEASHKMQRIAAMPCQHLWAIGSMTSSGQFNACCHDARSELTERGPNGKFANIKTTTFRQWWNGPFMTRLRDEHAAGVFRSPCASCAERDPWLG